MSRSAARCRALVAGLAALTALAACAGPFSQGTSGPDGATPTAEASAIGPEPTDLPAAGPAPPARGALVGAWVRPYDFTQDGRVEAFDAFEGLVGRQLDIAHVFRQWDEDFPTESDRALAESTRVLLLSWAGTDTRVIASGSQDELIRARARGIASLGVPILLRWRWEMDRPNLLASVWSPEDYVVAWKHIRAIFAEEGVNNVGWVWCPHARGFVDKERNPEAFYPGDDQVDWLCADVYAEPDAASFAEAATPFLAWAARHPKPIIIGEFGVREGDRGSWLRDAFAFVQRQPQIKALAYFDGYGNTKLSDHRLERSPAAVASFAAAIQQAHFRPPPSAGRR